MRPSKPCPTCGTVVVIGDDLASIDVGHRATRFESCPCGTKIQVRATRLSDGWSQWFLTSFVPPGKSALIQGDWIDGPDRDAWYTLLRFIK